MIVVAEPRSGGTKFCMDLAELTKKKFIGERYGCHLEGYNNEQTWKSVFHETKTQPVISLDDFFGKHDDKIVLCNRSDVLFACQQADYFVMRKNTLDTLKSTINFAAHTGIDIDYFYQSGRLNDILEIKYVLVNYCLYMCETVSWYDNQYYAKPVNVSNLSKEQINRVTDFYYGWCQNNNFDKLMKDLLTFSQ